LAQVNDALAGGARLDWRDAEDRGNCALHKAAEVGAVRVVEVLLKAEGWWGRGAAPSSRNAFNDSPLHAAAYKGHASVAQLLIEAQVCLVCVDAWWREEGRHDGLVLASAQCIAALGRQQLGLALLDASQF
jgi:ankyrin repeat protein